MWILKYDANELTYETETDSDFENKLMVTKGETWEGRINQEFGISKIYTIYKIYRIFYTLARILFNPCKCSVEQAEQVF